MATPTENFKGALTTIGAVILGFLLNMFVQFLWAGTTKNQADMSQITAEFKTVIANVDAIRKQNDEHKTLLNSIVSADLQREIRITTLQNNMSHLEKTIDNSSRLTGAQLQRLEGHMSDIQRAMIVPPRTPAPK